MQDLKYFSFGQNQQRELTIRHAREADKEMKRHLDVQKNEYEDAIKRHLSFIDQVKPASCSCNFQPVSLLLYQYYVFELKDFEDY